MRVLLSSTGGAGHFGPLVPLIEACARRGDDVLVVAPPRLEPAVARLGCAFRPGAEPGEDRLAEIQRRIATAPPPEAAVIANRELFGRLCTAALLPAVERACRDWRPDLVLREAAEYASAVAAERRGVPHAQVAISFADVEAGSLDLAAPELERYGDGLVERLRAAPYLTRFPASLDPSPFPATLRFREVPSAPHAPLPDWWAGSDAPLVYVTSGSVVGGLPPAAEAYRAAIEAAAGLDVRVLVTGVDAPGTPANVHVEAWVPQARVLPEAAVVLGHGGSGTTFGALAAGVPLVVVPFFADQPVNAARVAAAGAALTVEPGGALAPRLRAALETVLGDPSYRRAASTIAGEMRAFPPVDEVLADHRVSSSSA